MKTILITTYATNPYKGSEDGTGWNISREIAKSNKVIVITRVNNLPEIERYIEESKDPVLRNMTFYGFDLPNWVLWLKKRSGERGYVFYFYLWQLFITLFIKRKNIKFDIAHCLNFHSDSHPNFLWVFGKPTYWGPIGHHPKVPKDYLLPIYGVKSYLKDRLYYSVKWGMRNLDPFYRLAVWKSKHIFVINSSIPSVIKSNRSKTVILPSVACQKNYEPSIKSEDFNILSVGRFHYMKGFDISIRAFAKFYFSLPASSRKKTKLILVGKGQQLSRLEEIAHSENVYDQIEWVPWVERKKMKEIYKRASVFLFPSHEGAGMVIPEAMSYGLPILCFNNVGPGELSGDAGIKVNYTNYKESVNVFSIHLVNLFCNTNYQFKMGKKAKSISNCKFTWRYKSQVITQLYNQH